MGTNLGSRSLSHNLELQGIPQPTPGSRLLKVAELALTLLPVMPFRNVDFFSSSILLPSPNEREERREGKINEK